MDISKIKDFIPITTFIVIVCSVTKLITFYNKFNINIIDYITLPEIIFSFTDDIYNFFKVIIGYVIWWIIDDGIHFIQKKDSRNDSEDSILSGREFIRNLIVLLILLQLTGLVIGLIWGIGIGYLTSSILVYTSIIYVYIKGPKNHSYAKYFGLLIVFFFTVRSGAELEAEKLKQGSIKQIVTIKYKNELITSDSKNVYLGKTNNYSFFYNRQSNSSTIYANSEISMIEIKNAIRDNQ